MATGEGIGYAALASWRLKMVDVRKPLYCQTCGKAFLGRAFCPVCQRGSELKISPPKPESTERAGK